MPASTFSTIPSFPPIFSFAPTRAGWLSSARLRSIAGFVELSAGPWRVAQFSIEKISIAPRRWSSQSGALVKHKGVDEDGIRFGNAKLEASALDQLLDQPELGMRGQHHIELSIRL